MVLIESHYPIGNTGRTPMGVGVMLHLHLLRQWFGLGDAIVWQTLMALM